MNRFLTVVILLNVLVVPLAHAEAGRLPVPAAGPQSRAFQLVDEVYRDDLAKARTPAEKAAVARKMFRAGVDSKDDPAARYVLLSRAGAISSDVGDAATALDAVEQLAAGYDIDALATRLQILTQLERTVRSGTESKELAGNILFSLDAAVAADRYEVARQLADLAVLSANRSGDPAAVRLTTTRQKDVREVEAAYAEARKPLDVLRQHPDDAQANDAAGAFLCFMKGDWQKGLPMLQKAANSQPKALAARELGGVNDVQAQAALADAWWDFADMQQRLQRRQIQHHAAQWYQTALASLSGFAKARAQKRIDEAGPGAEAPSIGWKDVLGALDSAWTGVKGSWTVQPGKLLLTSTSFDQQRFMLPFATTGEYELQVKFSRNEGSGAVCIYVPAGDGECIVAISGWAKQLSAVFSSRFTGGDGASVPDDRLTNGREYELDVTVRLKDKEAELTILRDQRPFMHWKGPQTDLAVPAEWGLPKPNAFGVGSDDPVTISSVKVRMISGSLAALHKPAIGK